LARRGHSVTVVCPDPPPDWFDLGSARWEQSPFASSIALTRAEIRVATFWTTVEPAIAGAVGPVFHLCQGYEASFSFYAKDRDRIHAAYALPTRKLVVAPHLLEQLTRDGHSPLSLIGQVFEPAEFPPSPGRRFDKDVPEVLVVGPLEADVKGIRETLEAVLAVRKRGGRFGLRRISTTPPSDEERALGIASRHDLSLSPVEMARAYQAADLLIGPSHPQEGFGLPVLEALSSGLPCLLSDTPGHRFIAGEAAAYFAVGDARALAEALAGLLGNPSNRQELSRRGPFEARRFSTGAVVDRLLLEFRKSLM
jgi:glycosyltransferase involved in cell wall biosynthesis